MGKKLGVEKIKLFEEDEKIDSREKTRPSQENLHSGKTALKEKRKTLSKVV